MAENCATSLEIRSNRSGDDAEDVRFLHDQQLFAIDLDFGARPFAEQDAVARLDVERGHLAIVGADARTDGDDFAFLRLFLGGVGNDDATSRFFFGLDTADEHSVVQRTKLHGYPSNDAMDVI